MPVASILGISSPRIISTLRARAEDKTLRLVLDEEPERLLALLTQLAGLIIVDAERASPYEYAGYGVVYVRNNLY
jgi:hypothetical protein